MKTILCYGDSNTWGYAPDKSRYDRHTRWPGVLRDALGAEYWLIEEGLPGRTTVHDDPIEGAHKNGLAVLPAILESHVPLELVIILLGTNDLKYRFSLTAFDIAEGAGTLVHGVQQGTWGVVPHVLLVAPPPLATLPGGFAHMFAGGLEKSRQLAEQYRRVADELNCAYFDAGTVVTTSEADGVHWEATEHRKLGTALAEVVRGVLEP